MGIQTDIADLAELKRLADAAEKGGQHIYTHPRDSNQWAANRDFIGAASPETVLALIAQIMPLREAVGFAEKAFRTITSGDGSGHADLSRAVLRIAGTGVAACLPANCRQLIAASGKPYPRSSCASCGPFSPKWRECDAAIAGNMVGAAE